MQLQFVKYIRGTVGAAAGLLLLGAPALPSYSAPAASAGVAQFGSVDTEKVVAGYTKKASLEADFQQAAERIANQFKVQAGSPMLSRAQQDQLRTLLAKPNQTDADRAQVTALQAQSTQAAQQLTALQQKQNPTDADKTQLAALTKQQQEGMQALQDLQTTYQDLVQQQQTKMNDQLVGIIKSAVAAVAQQRGLQVVFDAHTAVYSSNDVTEEVIRRLNSGH